MCCSFKPLLFIFNILLLCKISNHCNFCNHWAIRNFRIVLITFSIRSSRTWFNFGHIDIQILHPNFAHHQLVQHCFEKVLQGDFFCRVKINLLIYGLKDIGYFFNLFKLLTQALFLWLSDLCRFSRLLFSQCSTILISSKDGADFMISQHHLRFVLPATSLALVVKSFLL